MAAFHRAEVQTIEKTGDGTYDVKLVVGSSAGAFVLKVMSEKADPMEAIETARQMLYDIGAEMAKALDQPGSLK